MHGIGFGNETGLITGGLCRRAWRPIYLGFVVICIGLFFANPHIVTLLCAVLATVILSVEVCLEETFLLSVHGETYKQYLSTTRRWI